MTDIKQETPAVTEAPKAPEATAPAAPIEAAAVTPPAAPAEPPKLQLAAGLFKDYTLGSRLAPGTSGNVMTNLKASPMDYQKKYEGSTRNQPMTAEQLAQVKQAPVRTPQIGNKK